MYYFVLFCNLCIIMYYFIRANSGDYFGIFQLHQQLVYWKKIAVKIGISPKNLQILIKVYARNFITGHILQGQPKGNSRNKLISHFRYCSLFRFISIFPLFKFHISSVTFYFFNRPLLIIVNLLITRQLNFINHLFYDYVIWIRHRVIPLIIQSYRH